MIRAFSIALLVSGLAASSVFAQDAGHGDEEHHVFEANGIEIVHPWARAAATGEETFVFFELHNEGAADTLLGASSLAAQDVHIVGLTMSTDGTGVQEVGEIDIPEGEFAFDPGGLALELHGLTAALEQGGHFDLVLNFANAGPVDIEVAVEAANANQHSHAGHSH
ncbi:copper chaperone PCu(A)C [uncultured Devosia sp.]|uniref:copper chaperone PCu(A)C n=1 Tax=uncultured Devosia sp. TaxID=211434 RepID=UPI0026271F23|nr:copper chaperone PCu(A)C [uncultured Devosia sp.]